MRKLKKYVPTKFKAKTSTYNKEVADYAVNFIECLCHTKGTWAGEPFELIDWQEQIIRDLFGTLKPNGYRQFNTAYIEIPKKMGKQLSLDTLIPTPDGFTTMGKINVGDRVFDERGKVCNVVAKSQVDFEEQAYKITFKDGEIIEAGARHQWCGEYTRGKNRQVTFTTEELYNLPKDGSSYRFRIPVADAIETQKADLPIDPYLIGYWLGNGSIAQIPNEYLRASIKQRLELLNGFNASKKQISDELLMDLGELLWSLGIKNYKGKRDDISKYRYIEKIEKIENRGMQCIQVDSPSHQYLVGRSFLPTHNSELAAAVALLLTCGDGEERAEVYGCAADRQQASIVFEVAADMIRMCPALNKRCKILAATKRIVYLPTNSFYQVLSAEAYSKHGFNIHGVVFDELHTQPNRKLFDVMTKGSGDARMQPLYFLITTAGTDTKSICYETHQKAKDIIEGRKIDPTFYPVIYGADDNDDWTDPKVWKKANPSLGITVGIDKVKAACESAKQNPAEENTFRQLRLNQWVKQAVRWMPMEKWDSCKSDFKAEDLEGRVCYGGLDLSSTTDITAFVLVFPPTEEDDNFYILPYFWIPEENMQRRVDKDHVPYDLWEQQGFIETTEGNVIHYGFIESFIENLGKKYNIKEIAFDRWGAVQMTQDLDGMGFTVIPFGQGFKDMSPSTKELMNLVLAKRLKHNGHPVLHWMMDNVCVRTDPAGNIKMDKSKSTEKIDGAVATVMALDRAIRNEGTAESVYDTRGLIII